VRDSFRFWRAEWAPPPPDERFEGRSFSRTKSAWRRTMFCEPLLFPRPAIRPPPRLQTAIRQTKGAFSTDCWRRNAACGATIAPFSRKIPV